ncbi:DUF5682 family protein [Shewanella algae]|uniref:DUF5682 family protein n=1 Tax=Shewanella algae TaxID=38313 RepID=UPI0031F54B54
MDEVILLREEFGELLKAAAADPGVCWLPLRHHSPACAAMALEQLQRRQPQAVLIEAPGSFIRHLSLLQRDTVVPPIAIYQSGSYYPLAENSPEWQALRWATAQGIEVIFIDLDEKAQERGVSNRWSDSRFLSSDYSRRLQQQLGCRDADELWQRLFEQQHFASAESFFTQVLLFCAASRACFGTDSLEEMGDLARETQMRAHIKAARRRYERVAVLTGGFHTPALINFADEAEAIVVDDTQDSFVIRFSDALLDARKGYGAGMPYPAFCRWQFQQRQLNADDWLLYLLEQMPQLPLIYKKNCFEHLQALCSLRGLARPGSYDLLDSLGSCLIKQQLSASTLEPWQKVLSGDALGQLPADQPSLPLVEEVLALCRKARLQTDKPGRCHFDLYAMTDKHIERRRLLCQLLFVGSGFARPQNGMPVIRQLKFNHRHEHWNYHWTPAVEVALAEKSSLGLRLELVVKRRLSELSQEDLQQLVEKLVLALHLGMPEELSAHAIAQQISQCSDIQQLANSFMTLLAAAHHPLFADIELLAYQKALWHQVGFHLPAINRLSDEEAVKLLLDLQSVAVLHQDELESPWRDRLRWLTSHNAHRPVLYFVLQALAIELDKLDPAPLLQQLLLQNDPFPVIEALLKVVPHWLRQDHGLLPMLNHWLSELSEAQFIDKLPAMRGLFCALDAREVDELCRRLLQLNQWDNGLNWLQYGISEQDFQQGLALERQLRIDLEQQGLSQWMSN